MTCTALRGFASGFPGKLLFWPGEPAECQGHNNNAGIAPRRFWTHQISRL